MRERACQVVVTRQLRWQNVSMGVVSGEIFPPLQWEIKIEGVEMNDAAIYWQKHDFRFERLARKKKKKKKIARKTYFLKMNE